MNEKVIYIESYNKFQGVKGSIKDRSGIIEKEERTTDYNPASRKISRKSEGVSTMEITQKEYIDQRIDSLEKSIDHRFDSTEKLLSEKMETLASRLEGAINNQNTKLDGTITNLTTSVNGKIDNLESTLNHTVDTKLTVFKEEIVNSQKSARNNIITWTLAGGAILATVGVAIVQTWFN